MPCSIRPDEACYRRRPRCDAKADSSSDRAGGKLGTAGSVGQESAVPHQSRLTAAAVKVKLGGLEVWALIDSGADFSMIKDGLQHRLKTELGCKSITPSRSAKGAGGNALVIVEVLCEVPVSIREESFMCPRLAVVSGLIYDVILVRDFCCRHRTVIDDEQGVFRIRGVNIPLPTYPEIRPPRARVVLEETITIPGRAVSMVAAAVHSLVTGLCSIYISIFARICPALPPASIP